MITADIKFSELCDEIDYWKEQTQKVEQECDQLKKEYNKLLDESIKHGQAMMKNQLELILNKQEVPNGRE